ncbi:MAG: NUDIX hydrolase [Marinilabiliales bacterium]|nr:MAG: NUDIX hydrolase [Marinilabiliales bacterium]
MTYTYKYPRPALTVDAIVFNNNSQVLLIQRSSQPFKHLWAFPGGFVDENETVETAVYRELEEETRIQDVELKQFHTYSEPDRDPRHRTVTVAFVGKVLKTTKPVAGDDAKNAKWFKINDLPPLAFDHSRILDDVLNNQ